MAGFNPVVAGLGDNDNDVWGATGVAMFTMTFAAGDTYLTNGFALDKTKFGLSRPIAAVIVCGYNTAGIGMEWFWNAQTQKLQARWTGAAVSSALAEVTNTTAIAGFVVTILVITQR